MAVVKAFVARSAPVDLYVTNLLSKIVEGKRGASFEKAEHIFSQGDPADAISFIEKGRIKISVVSASGKEAVLAMLGPHDFFGEGCLVGQSICMNTATTLEPTTVCQVEKRSMLRALRNQPELSTSFMGLLLNRSVSIEESICDQMFNHSERRLARILLKLGRVEASGISADFIVPRTSHETLSEMVGTTRSRVTFFMNKFKTMGLVDYNGRGHMTVKTDLLSRMGA